MIVRYHPIAHDEIIAATRYYARTHLQLGVDFLVELDKGVETITSNPLMFEQIRPGVRRYLLDRFPYGIYYRIVDDRTVSVVAVKHHSRRPGLGMRSK